jgi:hypothetical protein
MIDDVAKTGSKAGATGGSVIPDAPSGGSASPRVSPFGDDFVSGFLGATGSIGGSIASLPSATGLGAGVSNGLTAAADATRRGAAKVASGVKTAGGTVLGAPRQIGKTANTLWHAPPITKAGAVGVTAAVSGFVADAAFRGEMMEDNFFF